MLSGVPDPSHKPFEDVVTIAGIKDEVEVLKSLQAPKKARAGTLLTCVSLQIPVIVHVGTMYAILRGTSSSNLLPCADFGQGCQRCRGRRRMCCWTAKVPVLLLASQYDDLHMHSRVLIFCRASISPSAGISHGRG